MCNDLLHLSKEQILQLSTLIQKIVKLIQPELILCLGYRTTIMQDWSCFWEEVGYLDTEFPTTYDLLILISESEKRPEYELVQLIEQQATALACDITCMVQQFTTFQEGVEKGYRFDTAVYRKAASVYSSGRLLSPVLPLELTIQEIKNKIEAHWGQCSTTAKRFLKAATDCQRDNWPEQAVFNLHQSAQHSCMAMLRVLTGYRSTSHNLSRLLALIENCSYQPSTIFPCFTKEEKELFNLLNRAYSEARYKEDYTIPAEKVAILMGRVKELLNTAEQLYLQKVQELDKQLALTFPIQVNYEKAP
ncbi:HEPN domain-containing protein [Filimonas lacunae]|uniref:HEPN domain-containing protein n=1 Tax=Filimonas lacunae TaxID=477680 RepID=A0A173MBZ3_9BACT|nr:NT (Nucleotidyltransferase) domain and HEPN (Higher eukarytoes and prokaryotes nucleotide-binding) domain [Filimonas lacunae]SIT34252.1 HEPN domain-containing protein [Filimonas lacunae]